jgi:hypothetical protein
MELFGSALLLIPLLIVFFISLISGLTFKQMLVVEKEEKRGTLFSCYFYF